MRLSARSTITALAAALSLGLAACGDDGGGGDDVGPIEGDPHTYVVNSVTIPVNAQEASDLGFDLDDDGTVDNQLGNILSALINASGGDLDLQGSIDEAVEAGEILLLANVQATALDNAANAGFFLYLGSDPNPAACTDPADPLTCGQHLGGDASFTAMSAGDTAVSGRIVNGTFTGGPGSLTLQISFSGTAITLPLVAARAEVTGITATALGNSKVGGAVPDEDIDNQVIPAVHTAISDIIAEDCTGEGAECGCEDGSTGSTLLGIFDADENCEVPLTEVQTNNLIVTLLNPDVDTDGDGANDALSVGVGATAVGATFDIP